MCLYIETNDGVHKAERPIVCYKRVIVRRHLDDSMYITARYWDFPYKLGCFYIEKRFEMRKEELVLNSLREQYEVCYGFHSYVSEKDAKECEKDLNGYVALLRCEIPVNSHYYTGATFDDVKSYCSKSIRITGLKLCSNGIWDNEWMEPEIISEPGPLKRLLIYFGIIKI